MTLHCVFLNHLLGSLTLAFLENVALSLWTHVKQMKKPPIEYFFLLHIGQILRSHWGQYGFKMLQIGTVGPHSVSMGLNGTCQLASIGSNVGTTSFQQRLHTILSCSVLQILQVCRLYGSSVIVTNKTHMKHSKGWQQHNLKFKNYCFSMFTFLFKFWSIRPLR